MATIRKKSELNKFLEEYNGTELTSIKNTLDKNEEWIPEINIFDFRIEKDAYLFKLIQSAFNRAMYLYIQTKDFNISGLCLFTKTLNYSLFLELNDTQEIALYKLYKDDLRFEKINEYCDINELRRCVNEYDVTKDDFEKLVKETPTGLTINNENKLYLTHDGKIISGQTNPVEFKTIFGNQNIYGDGNIDLYNHFLTFTLADGTKLYINYQSSNALECDSLQDLTTMTKAVNGTKIGFGTTYINYNGSIWQTANSTNITAVEDVVTTA